MSCVVEYLGSAYAGFQVQPGKETVQATLEKAIRSVTGSEVRLVAAGRTDAGAHAAAQIVAFSTTSALPPVDLQRALNAVLPVDVAITQLLDVEPQFHPRFDAASRLYRYVIWNRAVRSPFWAGRSLHIKHPLDVCAMDSAVRTLIGEHNFGAFVPASWTGSRTRDVFHAGCRRDGDVVTIELDGSGFLKQMVRAIVGTIIQVGCAKLTTVEFCDIVKAQNRARAGRTVPACGLYLVGVRYPKTTIMADVIESPISASAARHSPATKEEKV